jgi:hypothetical protein
MPRAQDAREQPVREPQLLLNVRGADTKLDSTFDFGTLRIAQGGHQITF